MVYQKNMNMVASLKCVVVGDGGVGKTCMLISYCTNNFPTGYTPTVFDNYAVTVMSGETPHTIGLFDTAGQEEYDRLRVLAYPGANVFLLCFSVVNRSSFNNVQKLWVDELKEHCGQNVKFILVGTQVDLRSTHDVYLNKKHNNKNVVSPQEGKALANEIGAFSYVECSALTRKGLQNVFDQVLIATVGHPRKTRKFFTPKCLRSNSLVGV